MMEIKFTFATHTHSHTSVREAKAAYFGKHTIKDIAHTHINSEQTRILYRYVNLRELPR